jgi:hypothetical protein
MPADHPGGNQWHFFEGIRFWRMKKQKVPAEGIPKGAMPEDANSSLRPSPIIAGLARKDQWEKRGPFL